MYQDVGYSCPCSASVPPPTPWRIYVPYMQKQLLLLCISLTSKCCYAVVRGPTYVRFLTSEVFSEHRNQYGFAYHFVPNLRENWRAMDLILRLDFSFYCAVIWLTKMPIFCSVNLNDRVSWVFSTRCRLDQKRPASLLQGSRGGTQGLVNSATRTHDRQSSSKWRALANGSKRGNTSSEVTGNTPMLAEGKHQSLGTGEQEQSRTNGAEE